MRIDKRLNLVVPIERDDGGRLYVHAAPIGRDVFERYHREIARTFADIYTGGYGSVAGPRIALMLLRDAAQSLGTWDGAEGVERGLVAEMRRLSNVIVLNGKGWEPVPMDEAVQRGTLTSDDAAEVDNAIAFFTVASAMHRRKELPEILEGASKIWGAQTSSSNCTEYAASLPTSTGAASSGVTAAASSVPS